MNAYIYQAALLCEPCGDATRASIDEADKSDPRGRRLTDSDEYPQGPYPNGGGEADSPQHCDQCGLFLRNPLTSDGYAYVREQLALSITPPNLPGPALAAWCDYYLTSGEVALARAEGDA